MRTASDKTSVMRQGMCIVLFSKRHVRYIGNCFNTFKVRNFHEFYSANEKRIIPHHCMADTDNMPIDIIYLF